MTNERLTLQEMEQKYPDEWMLIVDCELSENTELLSGRVVVHSESEVDIHRASMCYKGGAVLRYTGEMQFPLKYQLEMMDFKMAMADAFSE